MGAGLLRGSNRSSLWAYMVRLINKRPKEELKMSKTSRT